MTCLRLIQEYNYSKEMESLDIKSVLETDCVLFDDDCALCDIAAQPYCDSMYSICTYVRPSRNPTFNYAAKGFELFQSVDVSATDVSTKAHRKYSEGLIVSLKSCGESAFQVRQALRAAQAAENSFINAFAAVVGHEVVHISNLLTPEKFGDDSNSTVSYKCLPNEEHTNVQLNVAIVCSLSCFKSQLFHAIDSVRLYVDDYELLRSASCTLLFSPLYSQKAVDDIAKLRALRACSKHFSSDSWICVLMNQL